MSELTMEASTGVKKSTKSSDSNEPMDSLFERNEIQVIVLIFIFLDIFISQLSTILAEKSVNHNGNIKFNAKPILDSCSNYLTIFFAFELVSLLIIFRLKFFSHVGYLLDCCVIGGQLYCQVKSTEYFIYSKLLNYLRVWRLFRIVMGYLSIEREDHDKTLLELESSNQTIMKLEDKIQQLADELKKEHETRSAVEDTLVQYKEEVDTLSEALKIAALDIAEVAQDDDDDYDEESEENEDGGEEEVGEEDGADNGEEEEEDEFQDASSSYLQQQQQRSGRVEGGLAEHKSSTMRKRDQLLRETMRDKPMGRGTGRTFVVHQDGSFEQR